jgi:hypothetical protein
VPIFSAFATAWDDTMSGNWSADLLGIALADPGWMRALCDVGW